MSAFGGKADGDQRPSERPLIAKSGHKAQLTGAAAVKEMLEAADMACYHQKTGPEGPVSLTGRIQKGPKTQSAGHNDNARLFFLRIYQGNATRFCGFWKKKHSIWYFRAHVAHSSVHI